MLTQEFSAYLEGRLRILEVHPAIIEGNFQTLLGMRVFSYSVMYKKVISGTIAEIFSRSGIGTLYDLIIDSDDNEIITTYGDSGILWYDFKGYAIGMHTNGNADESTTSYSTMISRIIDVFHIQNLYLLKGQ